MTVEELGFPIEFKQCPNCGSTRRVADIVTDEEVEAGRLKKGEKVPIVNTRALFYNPDSAIITYREQRVTALFGFIDACADCGTLYAVHIEKGQAGISKQPPYRQGQMPPGFISG